MSRRVALSSAVLVLSLLLILVGSARISVGAPPDQAAAPPPPRVLENLPEYLPPPGGTSSQSAPQVSAPPVVGWARLTFQSLRDGNWEIYVANGNGTAQTRLTDNDAIDAYPRLNRGCTRIVFVSNRDGNYEIYVMNADGTDQTRLTHTEANEYWPAWSPDGTRIAFSSYRDGQSEIYVMSANGSAEQRLTTHGAYDGMPAWSPDGSQIVFSSDRTGHLKLWRMNPDGSGQAGIPSPLDCQHPVWKPDGNRIAFDADDFGDGWRELWLMNPDGSSAWDVVDPAGTEDAWAWGWSPDARFLAFTRISFVEYYGYWFWTEAYLEAVDFYAGGTVRLSDSGLDWYPDLQTVDAIPPHSSVHRLPKYSRASGFPVNWSSHDDAGLVGLRSFDVEYRVAGSDVWLPWLEDTALTSSEFVGDPGTTVFFRSRARDHAFNLESPPANPEGDTGTKLYSWQVGGLVSDSRGVPLPDVSLHGAPPEISPLLTDWEGRYHGYLQALGTQVVTATKAAYASLPGTSYDLPGDLETRHWLPPADDLVLNGGFETEGLAGWQLHGLGAPRAEPDAAYTGQLGLQLGQRPPYAPPLRIPGAWTIQGMTTLVVDADHTVHLAWQQTRNPEVIRYARCSLEGVCLPPERTFTGSKPEIALGPDGAVHLVWVLADKLRHAQRGPNGEWSSAEVIGPAEAYWDGVSDLVVDDSGAPHVLWARDPGLLYSTRTGDGAWTAPEEVTSSGLAPVLAVALDGTVHAAWELLGSPCGVAYSRRQPGGGWEAPTLYTCPYGNPEPSLLLDENGVAQLAWPDPSLNQIRYTECTDGVCADPVGTIGGSGGGLQLVPWPGAGPVLVWTGPHDWYISGRRLDGTWSARHQLFGVRWDTYYPVYVAGVPGTSRLCASSSEGGNLFLSCPAFELETAMDLTLSQHLTLSPTLYRPTLALLYQGGSQDDPANHDFRLEVESELETTTLLTVGVVGDWTHAWFDMSPWQGQTITLTLAYSQTANDAYSWAYLDQISLGSWRTPYLETVTPAEVLDLATLPVTLTITGGNFIETPAVTLRQTTLPVVWQDESTLQAVVPAGTPPGIYALRVTNPGGQDALLPQAVRLGRPLYLPVVLR